MQQKYFPDIDWLSDSPNNHGMNSEKLSELGTIIESEYDNIRGIVVVKNGFIVYEKYYKGSGPNEALHLASVTKSILSALVGIAIHKGYINSADERVIDFFPEHNFSDSIENRQSVTIRNLLTMTAPYPFEGFCEPLDKLCASPDWVKYTLEIMGKGGNIGDFKYSTAGAHLLSAILTRSTGKSAREFANEYLLKPIGIKEIPHYSMGAYDFDNLFGSKDKGWVSDPAGNSTGGWGLTLSPREMARFGLLYLNHGVWNSKQIVPEAWVKESTAKSPYNYGYMWWLINDKEISAFAAMGDGGNTICCVPENDMVIAIASDFMPAPRDRWTLIKEHILNT